jgi:outer membrane receptor protein involved in Fe transport
MKITLFIPIIFTLLYISNNEVLGQTGSFAGKITDSETRNQLENATIHFESTALTYMADEEGWFKINNLKPGQYTVQLSHIGYAAKQVEINITKNATLELNTSLTKSNPVFSNILVSANKINAYSSISNIDLALRPVNSSQDVLKTIPSLFIAQHAGGGKAEQIFLRGFDIDHGTDINITVDGMPVNMVSHAHGQGYADLHFVIPETIDRVNFDKGSYQADKGNFTTAGFAAFKTKDFIEENNLKIQAGNFNTQRISGQVKLFSKQKNGLNQQLYIASEYSKTDGYFESPQDFKRLNGMAKYSLIKNNDSRLHIILSTFDSKWNASGQIPVRAVNDRTISEFGAIDDKEGGRTSRTNFSVEYSKRLQNNWKLSQQAYFTKYDFNLYSNFTFFLEDSINGDMINQREGRTILGYSATLNKKTLLFNKPYSFETGAGIRYDNIGNVSLSKAPGRIFDSYIQQGSIQEANSFLFTNHTMTINPKLILNASLRYDYFSFGYKNILENDGRFSRQNPSVFSPKLNVNYYVSKKVSLLISHGIGFHSNDSRVILEKGVETSLPKVSGTDIGFTIKPTRNLYIKTVLWHLVSDQEFVYVGDAGIVEPSGKSRRFGIDLITRYQFNPWLYGDMDLNFTKARSIDEAKGEDYIPLAPLMNSTGGLTAKLNNKLSASLSYRMLGDRPANEDYSVVAEGYFLADAAFNYTWKKLISVYRWKIYLTATGKKLSF